MTKRAVRLISGPGILLLVLFVAALPVMADGGSVQRIVVRRTLNGSTTDVTVYDNGWVTTTVEFDVAKGDPALEGAIVDVDMKTGKARSIERIRIKLQE